SGPVNRSCVSVAAIGSIQSGKPILLSGEAEIPLAVVEGERPRERVLLELSLDDVIARGARVRALRFAFKLERSSLGIERSRFDRRPGLAGPVTPNHHARDDILRLELQLEERLPVGAPVAGDWIRRLGRGLRGRLSPGERTE